jgi:hypothetical protein
MFQYSFWDTLFSKKLCDFTLCASVENKHCALDVTEFLADVFEFDLCIAQIQ